MKAESSRNALMEFYDDFIVVVNNELLMTVLLWSENVRIQEKLQTFCNFLGSSDFLNFNLFGNYQDNLVYNIFFIYIFLQRSK